MEQDHGVDGRITYLAINGEGPGPCTICGGSPVHFVGNWALGEADGKKMGVPWGLLCLHEFFLCRDCHAKPEWDIDLRGAVQAKIMAVVAAQRKRRQNSGGE